MTSASARSPRALSGRSLRVTWCDAVLFLVACKPLADAVSERSRDDQLGLGTAWTALSLVVFVGWAVLPRTLRVETWVLAASVVALLVYGAILMALHSGVEAILESAKVAIGFVPAVLLLDVTRRQELRHALRRWAPVFVAALGVHVVVAWLQFAGLVSMTYQQAGSGRPSGLFFHPVTLGYLLVAVLLVIAVLHQRRHIGLPLALPLATVVTLTIVIGTHRTSVIAAVLVVACWLLLAVIRVRLVHVRSLVVGMALIGLVVAVAVFTLPLWSGAADRALSGVTSVVTVGDLDPTSDRFLRGRGQRWATSLEVMAAASWPERIVGFGYQVVDPHSDYLRLPLVHGVLGSIIVCAALLSFWMNAVRRSDALGSVWLMVALAVMLVFAITTKPTSYPSFMWAWTMVVSVVLTSRRDPSMSVSDA